MKKRNKIRWLHIKSFFGKKLTNEEIVICIISKELKPFNKTYYDVVDRKNDRDVGKKEWYEEHEVTPGQNEEWRKWGAKFIKKYANGSCKFRSEKEMSMMDLQWGLKIKGGFDAVREYEAQKKKNGKVYNKK